MSSDDADSWLHSHGEAFLTRVGVRQGQCVLDFGCRHGQYTLPAARLVGPRGCVYGVDKDVEALGTLRQKIRELKIANIYVSRVTRSPRLPVPPETADIALVYDVLHGGYFPEAEQRARLLAQIHAALRPGGLLSCYLTHVRQFGLTFRQLHGEISSAGFRLEGRTRRRLVHDGNLVRGETVALLPGFAHDRPGLGSMNHPEEGNPPGGRHEDRTGRVYGGRQRRDHAC